MASAYKCSICKKYFDGTPELITGIFASSMSIGVCKKCKEKISKIVDIITAKGE